MVFLYWGNSPEEFLAKLSMTLLPPPPSPTHSTTNLKLPLFPTTKAKVLEIKKAP